jgi:hypothetical protein
MICGNDSLEEVLKKGMCRFSAKSSSTLNFVCVLPAPSDRVIYFDFYVPVPVHMHCEAEILVAGWRPGFEFPRKNLQSCESFNQAIIQSILIKKEILIIKNPLCMNVHTYGTGTVFPLEYCMLVCICNHSYNINLI